MLISYDGWPEGAGTIPSSRIYFNSSDVPGCEFYDGEKLSAEKLGKIPALLVTETGGSGPQFARVAYINGISQSGQDTIVHYATDSSMPTISNDVIEKHASQFGLGRWGLSHTCWKIQNFDLFKFMLMNQQDTAPISKVFSLDAFKSQDTELVSVMMPFDASFKKVFSAIKRAASACKMECNRADDIWEHHTVIQDVVNLIARARVVVCDCTGRNPNVFYETGIAHAIGKDVILIAQQESDIPFDLRHLRYVRYLNNAEGLRALKSTLESRITTIIGGA